MVDPSVHRYRLNLSESDESSGGSDIGSRSHRSRSRTRRSSVNSAMEMNELQREHSPKNSEPIDKNPNEESSSASSSESRSSSSSESSSSEGEPMQSSPKSSPPNRKSLSVKETASSNSVNVSMQSPPKAIPKKKSNPDTYLYSASSCSENESIQSQPKPTSKRKSSTDTKSDTSSSEDEAMQSSPISTCEGKSIPEKNTVTSSPKGESTQSSPRTTSKGKKSNYDINTGSSSSEDEPMQSSPKPTSKQKSNSDTSSGNSDSGDDSMQSSPKPISKGESISDTNTETSGSEDESMQASPKPTFKDKSIYDKNTGSSGSENEPMQSSPNPTLKGKSTPETNTRASSSENESMQSSPKPILKEKPSPETNTRTSSSEDESMQSAPNPTLKGKSTPETNTRASSSEDESMQSSPKPISNENSRKNNELIGLEEISSASNSEDGNERVLSKLSDIRFDNDEEKSLHKNPETVEDQQRKVLGDKLTVKFKVTLPEVGAGLIGDQLQFLRVPQFIPVESGVFDAETFKDSMTPDDLKDEQARGDFLNRLKTTVRWRENKDKTKESNARIVRWSDGSETFHVGAEVFDVMHHKVIDDKNHMYVRLENCYQAQGSITDKMTLRPKLDSTFGQSHVQGLRNRAMNKPQTGVVKVLSDLGANPLTDRDRRAKEEIANLRREEREKRREIQMSMRKPRVKPMRHCTADDSDPEQPTGDQDDLESETALSVCASSTGLSTQGIRTNRNVAVTPGRLESTDAEDEEDGYDSDVNDIINDDNLDGDDEEISDEPRTSTSKSKKAPPSHHSPKSDSDEGPKSRNVKRKTKQLIYSDSDSG